jgi:TonB family protein
MTSIFGLQDMLAQEPEEGHRLSPEPPALVVNLEPRVATFFNNLGDFLFRRQPPALQLSSAPAPFWPDVFVSHRLPWGAFAESLVYHGIVFALAWGVSSLIPPAPHVVETRRFDPADVIYYTPSEYLPPLDTGGAQPVHQQKGDPVLAKQPILSVPPEADNRRQTIVTPPDIKLNHDIETPNIVAWGDHTVPVPGAAIERKTETPVLRSQIIAPAPEVKLDAARNLSSLGSGIVAPAPEVGKNARVVASMSIDVVAPAPDAGNAGSRNLRGLQTQVVEPPPAINAASVRKLGDVNIGRSEAVAPAPQLAVEAQRTAPSMGTGSKGVVPPPPSVQGGGSATRGEHGGRALGGTGTAMGQVVPPPPAMPGSQTSEAGGRLIALGIHPAVSPPAEPPRGNRRGTFAAGPEGKADATGAPEIRGNATDGSGAGSASSKSGAGPGTGAANASGAPPGLHVGAAQPATSATAGDPSNAAGGGGLTGTETAALTPPPAHRAPRASPQPKAELVDNPSQLERQIFRDRRLYRMTQNMPNLNSAGGSWVIRFAELDSAHGPGEISAPVADHKVDPAYPLQLMRENVAGTVTLHAIIRADGTVSDIKVVNGADPRLDHYATQAFARWHFLPALKNDASVDVEAIVIIPFKPILRKSVF